VIVFGGINKDYMLNKSGEFVYSKIVSYYSYRVKIDGFSLGGKFKSEKKALVDSGTTCLTFPS
jgi:hypothetical protein